MEQEGHFNLEDQEEMEPSDLDTVPTFHFIRHSKSGYRTYNETLKNNPTGTPDLRNQLAPDLTEEGLQLARDESEKFLKQLDPEKDILYFISSPEQRALDTANVYLGTAEKQGFTIIESATEKDRDRVRAINSLGINIPSYISVHVFNPQALVKVNEKDLDEETKEKWRKARQIIDADDKGSWGANFDTHGEAIKEIFTEVETAEDLYKRQFGRIVRLLKFADRKIKGSDEDRNIKVLGFGHENYVTYFLNKYFQEKDIKNCEAIGFEVEDDQISATYRGKKEVL